MPYQKTNFINNNEPPISAQNLNKMEQGIYDNSVAVESATSLLGGHYVQKDVPANAVFTDTIYDDTSITTRMTAAEGDIENLEKATEHLSDGEVTYPYASEIEIEDALGANAKDVSVKITAQQDLHGYDHPWAGGAGKNKLKSYTRTQIKAANTNGVWSGDSYTLNGVTFACVFTVEDEYFVSATISGTSSSQAILWVSGAVTGYNGDYYLNGGISANLYATYQKNGTWATGSATGNDLALSATSTDALRVCVVVNANIAASGTFYPMIRLSTVSDATFEPYSNNCSISGWDECEIGTVGKNRFDKDGLLSGGYKDGVLTANVEIWHCKIPVKAGETYTISGEKNWSASWNSALFLDVNNNVLTQSTSHRTSGSGGISSQYTITAPSNAAYLVENCYIPPNPTTETTTKFDDSITIQIEKSSTAATTYEPYQGKTYTIQLGDTIYGGTIDVTNGVMTVDRGYAVFDGSSDENWSVSSNRFVGTLPSATLTNTTNVNVSFCNAYEGKNMDTLYANRGTAGWTGVAGSGGGVYVVDNVTFPSTKDATAWKTYLASNHLQVCYELATPFTVQLTPQQIQLLEGYNYLTANTGDIQVTTTDIKGAIGQADELIEANTKAIKDLTDFDLSIFGTVEKGTTASKAYAQGDYFVKDKKMCKALTSIASGATFTLNTNYAAYTIAEILKAIEQS